MPDLQTFLDEQGTVLMHKAPRVFDESKVKRNAGRFAKKEGGASDKTTDDAWLKPDNLNGKLDEITKAVAPAFGAVVGAVVKKFGLKSRAELAKNPEARAEAVKAAVKVLNNYAENRAVSPSGGARIQYRVGNHGHIIAGVVTKDGYKVIPKKADTSLRLEASAPTRATPKPFSVATGVRPTSTTVDRPATKPAMQRPSATAAVDKKINPFRNTAALTRRADQQIAVTGKVDPNLQKFLDKVKNKKLKHDDPVGDFFEHHGIKGMKWGVRRSDAQISSSGGGRVAQLKAKFSRNKVEPSAGKKSGGGEGDTNSPAGSGHASGGGSSSGHVAVDHERMLEAMGKTVDQMSTQEIQQATNRAQALQNYQRVFAPENKSPLEQRVAQLNLEKQRRDLEAQLNPPQKSALNKLVEKSQQGFAAYQTIDKALGGDLSKTISRKLGTAPPPSAVEQAKMRTELAKASKAEADARAAISTSARTVQTNQIFKAEESVLKMDILRGDLPSKAEGFVGAGKRRAVGDFKVGSNGVPKFVPASVGVGSHIIRGVTPSTSKPSLLGDLINQLNTPRAKPGKHRK